MHKLRINPMANKDLVEIKKYISEKRDDPRVAISIITKIINSYEQLKEFPMLGIKLSKKIDVSTDLRYLISGNYIIFYKVDDVYVSIYRILDGKRDYLKILFYNNIEPTDGMF